MKTNGQQHQGAVVGYKHGKGKKKEKKKKNKQAGSKPNRGQNIVSGNVSLIRSRCSCHSAICPTCLIQKGDEENHRRITESLRRDYESSHGYRRG